MGTVSPTFEVEDQADEEFFDNLVEDDDDYNGVSKNKELDQGKSLTNLGKNVVTSAGVDLNQDGDLGNSAKKGKEEEGLDDGDGYTDSKDEETVDDGNLGNSSKKGKEEEGLDDGDGYTDSKDEETVDDGNGGNTDSLIGGVVDDSKGVIEVDNETSENNVRKGASVKQVDWSAFNCSDLRSGAGTASYSDFFNELGGSSDNLYPRVSTEYVGGDSEDKAKYMSQVNAGQQQEGQNYWLGTDQAVTRQDQSIQYWESLYPGWKYDANTGQWFQLEGYNEPASSVRSYDTNAELVGDSLATTQQLDASYIHQTGQYTVGNYGRGYTDGSLYNQDQGSHVNSVYPAHMLFDPQYPGWYYDSIAQEWRSLESYTAAVMRAQVVDNYRQKTNHSTVDHSHGRNNSSYGLFQEPSNHSSHGLVRNDQSMQWYGTTSENNHQSFNNSQSKSLLKSEAENQLPENSYSSNYYSCMSADQQNQQTWYKPSATATSYENANKCSGNTTAIAGMQSFSPDENLSQHLNQHNRETSQQIQLPPAYVDNQKASAFPRQLTQSGTQLFSNSDDGRSSAGRPPHALVSFGFGGKLVVTRGNSSLSKNSPHGNQDADTGVISIINLVELVMDKLDPSSIGSGARNYFCTLCQQSFPGPLVGVSFANKELTKWIDDKIANCGSPGIDYRKGELLRLLFSLLKISCQYKGKLRSPFGTDRALKESDSAEAAVADLFASAKRNMTEYAALSRCVQNFPSESRIQATALNVQKLLVSGRIKEALQFAQEGQLWGPALVLATQLGDQFYSETVKQMALRQLPAGSPLRTLCLLISGQPADVFCCSDESSFSSVAESISQQPSQTGALAMLHNWEENLAIITANRTKDDELVIIHLGDCLLKEKGEVLGAHICYLVAEANFETYSDSARICLIGADHWRSPRTYASPEAIQRTELYEYSKSLGNPQFLLLPFQPYKLIYAFMLAELGKLTESLRYCQAILKCWKIGRAPEVDTWKHLVLSLEERLRIHQQGGYSASSAPAKLVGKFLNLFDSTAQRVRRLPPPVPSPSHNNALQKNERHKGPRLSNGQSTASRPSLVPSASMEPISEWTGNRTPRHNRSISEPDIGTTPAKSDSSKEASSSDMHENSSGFGGYYRFGSFGSQLFQKTVGRVLGSRPDHQAKLGEKNKFYYDEKLKRWVEEGVDIQTEETALPPPPTTSALQKKVPQENSKDGLQTENIHGSSGNTSPSSCDSSSGVPPMPRGSIHSTTRGRKGIRARYVDTFNKGAAVPANKFQSSAISPKPGGAPTAKFFVPTPMSSPSNETLRTNGDNIHESSFIYGSPTSFTENSSMPSPSSKSTSGALERVPSMDNIATKMGVATNSNTPSAPHSRRTVSWSGSFSEVSNAAGFKTLGEALSTPPWAVLPGEFSPHQLSSSPASIRDELHEVELK